MNDTGAGVSDVTVITATHLLIIGLLAIAAILAIWWGGRRRRERLDSTHQAEERRSEVDEATSGPLDVAPPRAPDAAPRVAAPPVHPAPAPIAETLVAAPASVEKTATEGLPVTTLKGLGPKVAARLAELGVTNVGQLAALSSADAAALDAQLGAFSGRMARDRWIDQARLLVAGDKAGFEAQFGKLG